MSGHVKTSPEPQNPSDPRGLKLCKPNVPQTVIKYELRINTNLLVPPVLFSRFLVPSVLFSRFLVPPVLFSRFLVPSVLFSRFLVPPVLFSRFLVPSVLFSRFLVPPVYSPGFWFLLFILQGSGSLMFSSLTNTIFTAADLSSDDTPPDITACFKTTVRMRILQASKIVFLYLQKQYF